MKHREDETPIALKAYEALAERYAALIETKAHNAFIERPTTLSLLPPVKGKCILDAGCGPGVYSEWLVNHGAVVTAIDISPKMVEFARQRLGSQVDIRLADLSKPLDFLSTESFDVILSSLVLDYIYDWKRLFTEFFRILRNDGVLIYSVCHPLAEFVLRNSENYFATELNKTLWTGFGIPVMVPSYRRPLSGMISPLKEAGFKLDQILEPQPTEECRTHDPDTYEKGSKQPTFLCIRAYK